VPVGIIGDFHNESLYEPMKPTIILAQKSPIMRYAHTRSAKWTEAQVAAGIHQKLWKQLLPDKLLVINNIEDQLIDKQYEAESKDPSTLSLFQRAYNVPFGTWVFSGW
jgi:putative ABC transport system permease protein